MLFAMDGLNFNIPRKVEVTKTATNNNRVDQYPVGTKKTGLLEYFPKVGEPIMIYLSSGKIFATSLIEKIKDNTIMTENSVWELKFVD